MNIVEYGINLQDLIFKPSDHKGNLFLKHYSFKLLRDKVRTVSLNIAFLMYITEKITESHKPFYICTFKEMADDLKSDPRVLRRYVKKYAKEKDLKYFKLLPKDCSEPDQYMFLLGENFGNYLWDSKLFRKKMTDYYHFIEPESETQRDHHGPRVETKGSATDPQRVHHDPSSNSQNSQNTDEIPENRAPVFFMPSYKNLSSEEKVLKVSFNKDLSIKNLSRKWVVEESKMRVLWGAVEGHGYSHSGAPIKKDVGAYLWKYYPDALKFFQPKPMHLAAKREEPLEEATLPPANWMPHLRKRPTGSIPNWTESENEIVRRNRENFQIQKEAMLRSASL